MVASSVSIHNRPCTTRPTHTDLNPNEQNQRLRYYPFMANLDNVIGLVITLLTIQYVFQAGQKM